MKVVYLAADVELSSWEVATTPTLQKASSSSFSSSAASGVTKPAVSRW